MKKKELGESRKKSEKDLGKTLKEKKLELVKSYAEVHAGKEKNLKKMKLLKREIAQILTIMDENKLIESMKEKEAKKE